MHIILEQLWATSFNPWQSDSPWETISANGCLMREYDTHYTYDTDYPYEGLSNDFKKNLITITQQSATTKYGINVLVSAISLQISQIEPSLKYGINLILTPIQLTLSSVFPDKIGSMWERLVKVSTIWTKILKSKFYDTVLSYDNNETYDGFTKFSSTEKPTTSYTNVPKVSTVFEDTRIILWSIRNYPWTSLAPWKEKGGIIKTTYTEITKPHN